MADTPTTDAPDDTGTDTSTDDQQPDTAQLLEQLKKANAEAKRYRLEARDHAAKLEQLNQQNMTETEKAIEAARIEARADAVKAVGARLVDAEVRAAAAGRNLNVKALLKGLDRSQFLTDDGEPDTDAISKWLDDLAPSPDEPSAPRVLSGPRGPINPKADPGTDFAKFLDKQLSGRG